MYNVELNIFRWAEPFVDSTLFYKYIAFIGSILDAFDAGIIPNTTPTITEVKVEPIKLPIVKTGANGTNIPTICENKYPNNIPSNPPIPVIKIASNRN